MADTEVAAGEKGAGQLVAPARRRLPVVPILILVALLGGMVYLLLLRTRPEEQVRRLIDTQLKLARAGRFGELHGTLSPGAKKACPAVRFKGALAALPADFWDLIEYQDIHIAVDGDRAVVSYVITYNGRPIERATSENPDLYIRATETVLGPRPNVSAALANLDRSQQPGLSANPLPRDEYLKRRADIIKRGQTQPIVYQEGEWYDDLDQHVRCP
jgi:hypothetical protein